MSKQSFKLSHFLSVLILLPFGETTKLDPMFFNFKQIRGRTVTMFRKELAFSAHFFLNNLTDVVLDLMTNESNNWTVNHDCFRELHQIKSGLNNFDEWAIECNIEMLIMVLSLLF